MCIFPIGQANWEVGLKGGIEVSYYSGGVMLSALACGREQLRMSPTNVTRARR